MSHIPTSTKVFALVLCILFVVDSDLVAQQPSEGIKADVSCTPNVDPKVCNEVASNLDFVRFNRPHQFVVADAAAFDQENETAFKQALLHGKSTPPKLEGVLFEKLSLLETTKIVISQEIFREVADIRFATPPCDKKDQSLCPAKAETIYGKRYDQTRILLTIEKIEAFLNGWQDGYFDGIDEGHNHCAH